MYGALSGRECAELLARVNAKGFTPALVNTGLGKQVLKPKTRDGFRVIVDSQPLAAWLLEVLRPHLPQELEDGSQLVELNERCRFLCYTPGQAFEAHCDASFPRPSGHQRAGDRSRVTVQLYLHDVPEAHGGATTFDPARPHAIGHQPAAGSVLLFSQDLRHEGSLLRQGLKYTLRTEVMYAPRGSGRPMPTRWVHQHHDYEMEHGTDSDAPGEEAEACILCQGSGQLWHGRLDHPCPVCCVSK